VGRGEEAFRSACTYRASGTSAVRSLFILVARGWRGVEAFRRRVGTQGLPI
jgi:hypothetical protein